MNGFETNRIKVSIVIVNYNGLDVILECLSSIYRHTKSIDFDVTVVDNCSKDSSPDFIARKFPQVRLLRQSRNWGFGIANNIGVRHSQGDYLLFLNSDTCFTADILPQLVAKLECRPDVGIVGPKLLNPDGSFQLSIAHEIGIFGEFLTLLKVKKLRNSPGWSVIANRYRNDRFVEIVVGAAMFMRRSLFTEVGGFDESFFMYFEESDLCKRVRDLGYKILYAPEISLIHIGGHSVAKSAQKMAEEYRRSQRYYYQKHRPRWEQWLLHGYLWLKKWRQARALQLRNLSQKMSP